MERAILAVRDDVVLSAFYENPHEAHKAIKKSLHKRLKSGWLSTSDQITVVITDASGYFTSCPQIFPGYYRKTLSVSEYLAENP